MEASLSLRDRCHVQVAHAPSSMARSGRTPATPRSPKPQRRPSDFLPLGFPPIPRETRNSAVWRPSLRYGPQAGAASIAFGLWFAIEAAMGAGSKTAIKEFQHGHHWNL